MHTQTQFFFVQVALDAASRLYFFLLLEKQDGPVLIEHVSLPKTYHATNFSKLVAKENMFSCFHIVFFFKGGLESRNWAAHGRAHAHVRVLCHRAWRQEYAFFVFLGDFFPGFVWGKVVWCGLGVSRAG